jgi:hypothetical protein
MATDNGICDATIEFSDDHGDNSCTFHCQLGKGHSGKHQETGVLWGKPYKLEWADEVE